MKVIFMVTLITALAGMGMVQGKLIEVGTDWERHANDDGSFTVVKYSQAKYFFDGENWIEIDEDFKFNNCKNLYETCQSKTNLYKTHMKLDPSSPDFLAFEKNGETLYLNWESFSVDGKQISLKPLQTEINGNQITYYLNQDYWLRYTYTPTLFKEEIIIWDEKIREAKTITAMLSKKNSNQYALISHEFVVCDGDYRCRDFEVGFNNNQIKMFFNDSEFLKNATLPITIDPIITINDTLWDGYVWRQTGIAGNDYGSAQATRGEIVLGTNAGAFTPAIQFNFRGGIEYNLTDPFANLTDDVQITEIMQYIYMTQPANNSFGNDTWLNYTHLEKEILTWNLSSDIDQENFYNDTGNGTVYNSSNLTAIPAGPLTFVFNSEANQEYENRINDGDYNISVGLRLNPEGRPNILYSSQFMRIASSFHGTGSWRHYQNITYIEDPCIPPNSWFWDLNRTCRYDNETVVFVGSHLNLLTNGQMILNNATFNQTNTTIHWNLTGGLKSIKFNLSNGGRFAL